VIIKSVRIRNFRSILDETLHCEPLTVLIGPNGSGKSCFLRALQLFYDTDASYTDEDFYWSDTDNPIQIGVTFGDLTGDERNLFAPYLTRDVLPVEKELRWPRARDSQKYYGATFRNPDFRPVREAHAAADKRTAYAQLAQSETYRGTLPRATTVADIEEALQAFEVANADRCEQTREETQFFGYTRVGGGRLDHFTQFRLLPAVKDASDDATEARGSAISVIMDLLVRTVLQQRGDIAELRQRTRDEYDRIIAQATAGELDALQRDLTATLATYAPEATVSLSWRTGEELDIPPPTAYVRLVEDGYGAPVGSTGHGLQRAFILTLLEHVVAAQASTREPPQATGREGEPGQAPQLNLVLAIEEPELYQHPSRQRHLANVLLRLAKGQAHGLADRMQVIYSTHSPLLVGVDRLEQVRLLRKEYLRHGKPRQTRIRQTTRDEVADDLCKAHRWKRGSYTGQALAARLRALMTPWMNEGFFADVVVLVEGEGDRAAVIAAASAKGHDLESMGISVIPCMGVDNVDKPTAIFKRLGLPVYPVWDNDRGNPSAKRRNRSLLRLCGHPEQDYPEVIGPGFACLNGNLESVLRSQIGESLFETLLDQCQREYSIPRPDHKNPVVLQRLMELAAEHGKHPESMNRIVEHVLNLRAATRGT
jgi:hypothetical protein